MLLAFSMLILRVVGLIESALSKFILFLVLNENSNIVILKLQGVHHTQLCDHPCGIEVI
jgi:hypothetical protein